MPKVTFWRLTTQDNIKIPLFLVTNLSKSGDQGVIVYEIAGRQGGLVVTTGAKTRTLAITATLIKSGYAEGTTLQDIDQLFEDLKDSGQSFTLTSPFNNLSSNKFIISNYTSDFSNVTKDAFLATISFTEFSQANVKQAQVNLVNFGPAEEVLDVLRSRNIIS